jgi:hypothetical protein
MADITRADFIELVLRHIGRLAISQTANAADAALVGLAADSAYDRLNKKGYMPFSIEAIPAWAQIPLRDFVAIDVSPTFGIAVDRLPNGQSPIQNQAIKELHEQTAGYKHKRTTRGVYE